MNPQKVVAKTLYGEARNQGEEGIRAVATVIYNRAKGNISRLAGVCLKPKQFSCWNGVEDIIISSAIADKEAFKLCNNIAKEMLNGNFIPVDKEFSIKFTHYCTVKLFNSDKCAKWIKQVKDLKKPVIIIKDHVFMETN